MVRTLFIFSLSLFITIFLFYLIYRHPLLIQSREILSVVFLGFSVIFLLLRKFILAGFALAVAVGLKF